MYVLIIWDPNSSRMQFPENEMVVAKSAAEI